MGKEEDALSAYRLAAASILSGNVTPEVREPLVGLTPSPLERSHHYCVRSSLSEVGLFLMESPASSPATPIVKTL